MARIRTYDSQLLPQGSLRNSATAADFGAEIGEGMQVLGNQIQRTANELEQQKENDELSLAQRQISERQQYWTEEESRRQLAAVPGDRTYATKLREDMSQDFANLAGNYSTKRAQDYVRLHGTQVTTSYYGQALNFEARQNAADLKINDDARRQADYNVLLSNPSNYAALASRYEADVMGGVGKYGVAPVATRQALVAEKKSEYAWYAGMGLAQAPGAAGAILKQIGVAPNTAPAAGGSVANAIFAQESGSGKADTSRPNIDGALGPMQITEATWKTFQARGVIPADWSWNNAQQNKQAGYNIVAYYEQKYQGDVAKVAAAYFGGEGAINADGTINRDRADSNGKTIGSYVDDIVRRVGSPVSTELPPGLKAETGNPILDAMPADMKLKYVQYLQSKANQENALGRATLNKTLENHFAEAANTGYVSNKLNRAAFEVAGPDAASAYQNYVETVDAYGVAKNVQNLPFAQQTAFIEQLRPVPGDPEYANKDKRFRMVADAVAQGNKAFAADPVGVSVQRQTPGITLLQDANPQNVAKELAAREPAVDTISGRVGQRVVLSNAEAAQQGAVIRAMAPDEKVAYLKTIRDSGIGTNTFSAFVQQVAKDSPATMAAGLLLGKAGASVKQGGGGISSLWTQEKVYTAETVANKILAGVSILDKMPGENKQDGNGSARGSMLPDNSKMWAAFADATNGAWVGRQQSEVNAAYETVKAYYIGDQFQKGNIKGELDTNGFTNAVKLVLGSPIEIGASKVFAPWGMDQSVFKDQLKLKYDAQAKAAGIKVPYDTMNISALGDGRYGFSIGSVPQMIVEVR